MIRRAPAGGGQGRAAGAVACAALLAAVAVPAAARATPTPPAATATPAPSGGVPGARYLSNARRIAVLDTRVVEGQAPGVEGLSALIASEAAKRPAVAVVTGADIRAMIGFERERQLLGCDDAGCMAELGGALGVDLVLTSELTRFADEWLLTLSLIDIRRGQPVARLTRREAELSAIVDAAPAAVRELLGGVAGEGKVAGSTGTLRTAGVITAVAGLAAVGAGVYFGLSAAGAAADATALPDDTTWSPDQADLEGGGQRDQTIGLVLDVAGGAAIAAGVVLYVIGGAGDSPPATAGLSAGRGGMAWAVAF